MWLCWRCAPRLIVLKILPPRDQARVMQRLPGPMRQAVGNLLFPHPDLVPTPGGHMQNVSALLTPQAVRQPSVKPTATPTPAPEPTSLPTLASTLPPTLEPILAAQNPIVIPSLATAATSEPKCSAPVGLGAKRPTTGTAGWICRGEGDIN